MEIVYQSDDQSVTVYFDAAAIILMVQYNGIVAHETYEAAYTELIDLVEKHTCKKVIYDIKKLKKVSVRSRVWYLNHVAPQMIQGNVRSAIVDAEQIGNQVATATMRDALLEMGYSADAVQRFDTLEAALTWLNS